jgi:hypothetical protein
VDKPRFCEACRLFFFFVEPVTKKPTVCRKGSRALLLTWNPTRGTPAHYIAPPNLERNFEPFLSVRIIHLRILKFEIL